jgi:hypothetical protein
MDDAGEFFDAAAETYDALLGADSGDGEDRTAWAGDDVAFYRDLARDADGPALEVGVGTGRVYLPLLRDGTRSTASTSAAGCSRSCGPPHASTDSTPRSGRRT